MSAPLYLLGAGGHAKVVLRALQARGERPVGLLDDREARWGERLFGVPVLGPLAQLRDAGPARAVVAIGDNRGRAAVAAAFEHLEVRWHTVVHPAAVVDREAVLAPGCVVMAGSVVQADARLGAHCIVNTGASVDHDCVLEAYCHLGPGAHLAGGVRLHQGVFFGAGAVATPNRRVGAWSTVGAGAVVVRDIAPETVAVGVPARPLRSDPRKGDPQQGDPQQGDPRQGDPQEGKHD